MRTLARALLVGAVLLSHAVVAAAADTVTITLPPDHGALPPGPGMEVTQKACQTCHSTDYIAMQPRGGEAQWRGRGAEKFKGFGAPDPQGGARADRRGCPRGGGAGRGP